MFELLEITFTRRKGDRWGGLTLVVSCLRKCECYDPFVEQGLTEDNLQMNRAIFPATGILGHLCRHSSGRAAPGQP